MIAFSTSPIAEDRLLVLQEGLLGHLVANLDHGSKPTGGEERS